MGKHAIYTTDRIESGLFTTEKYMMYPNPNVKTCPHCKGTGRVKQDSFGMKGYQEFPCRYCNSTGVQSSSALKEEDQK